ncbi:glutathione peroxidase [Ilumatobacter coccineus YM16-304]|uniref:Glutathione peroxidase n=1 Tax=Ilumatobacter coccineus (strain NBRC 103263 / KCTC 29153 / YM16-304) TaxID=1313172 RepID=A0A6C7ECV9_ILUCY|nr:glutathione peroxidase [Ilumatobacter coccineus YM16-304]
MRVGHRPTTVVEMKFHDITMTSITGDQVTFDDYKGKLVLVVNVASA